MSCWCKGACPVVRIIRDKINRGQRGAAEHELKLSLVDAPDCVEANLWLADILTQTNRAAAAELHIDRAIARGGSTLPALLARASNYRAQTKIAAALKTYDRCTLHSGEQKEADKARGRAGYISTLQAAGDIDGAEAAAIDGLKLFPDDAGVRAAAAAISAERGNFQLAADQLGRPGARPLDMLDRGRYLDRAGDYAGAWGAWAQGKAILRKSLGFNRGGFDFVIGGLLDMATKSRQAAIPFPKYPAVKPRPVLPMFVTGFTRSGTTMIETALAAHSKITAADELSTLPEITRTMGPAMNIPVGYPAALAGAAFGENVTVLGLMREQYLRRAEVRAGPWPAGALWFTDKMPLNEVHLPLILRLFPESPVYYVRRHPLDAILSNFSYHIAHFENYGAGLRTLAYAYAAIDGLVEKYKQLWPGKLIEIRYESFVTDHRAAITAALGAADLEPEEACFEFHKSGRFSRTISHRQIKEPVYDRSVGRWKNYRQQLEPIMPALAPICEREGYAL